MSETESPDDADISLMFRVMDKDEDAIAELFDLYAVRIKGYLKRNYGDVLKEPEIDQAVTDAFAKVWRFAGKFNPDNGRFRSWLIRIAQNAAIDILRGEERHKHKDLEYDPSYEPADGCGSESPEVDTKEHARLEALNDFIYNKLTGFEQIVAINCFKAGGEADCDRLAALYGKNRANVDTVKSKVKKKITDALLAMESQPTAGRRKP